MSNFDANGQQKSGSGWLKVVIVIACLFGVLCMACCGGMYYFGRQMANSVTNKPEDVQRIASEISDLKIPDGLKPMMGMDATILGKGMRYAVFSEDQSRSLMLMEFTTPFDPNVAASPQFNMQQQPGAPRVTMQMERQAARKVKIKGQVCQFMVGVGKDEQGKQIHSAVGSFPSKTGNLATLLYAAPAERMSEEQMRAFVDSLGEPVADEAAPAATEATEKNAPEASSDKPTDDSKAPESSESKAETDSDAKSSDGTQ